MAQTIASFLITPDGTKLQSYHRHDYKTHKDANGEEYMIDGGTDYQRGSVNKQPAEAHLITMDDPHHLRREHFCWGTRGRDGKQPLTWKPLKDLDTDHIEAILATQHHISNHLRQLFSDELQWRKSHDMLDTLVQLAQEQGDYS